MNNIKENLYNLPEEIKLEFDNYNASDFEKAIVVDLFGLGGTKTLSWNEIINKYKDYKGKDIYNLQDLHNIENKAYYGLKCVINTPLYLYRKAKDLEYIEKMLATVSELSCCYSKEEGIIDDQIFSKLIEKRSINFQDVIRLFYFSERLKLDIQVKEEIENKNMNKRTK
jgi:hypothetical protein